MNSFVSEKSITSSKILKYLIISTISATLLFALLSSIVVSGVTNSFDEATLLWINQHASSVFDAFFVAFTELGGVVVISLVSIALLIYFLLKKAPLKATLVAAGIGGAALLNIVLKSIFDRARPDLWEWLVVETHFSFPSGHATASMALAMIVIALLWKTKWRAVTISLAAVYVLSIGISRLYLGVHYPTDIIGGWLLAIAWVSFVIALIIMRSRKLASKEAA